MQKLIFITLLLANQFNITAQLNIGHDAIFYIQQRGEVQIEGSLSSLSNIEGAGSIQLIGKYVSVVHMNGFHIANLVVNCTEGAILESNIAITSSLILRSGHLLLNKHNILLHENAVVTGSSTSYIQNTGTGYVQTLLSPATATYLLPIGTPATYMPLTINNVRRQHGLLEVNANSTPSSHKPPDSRDFLRSHWKIKRAHSLQNVVVTGHFKTEDVEGNTAKISAHYWNGSAWTSFPSINHRQGTASAELESETGELYAMSDTKNPVNTKLSLLNNPASSFTVLQVNAPSNITFHLVLRDAKGSELQRQQIKTLQGLTRHVIYLHGLSKGTYFLDVASPDNKQSLKFLKVD
jgi:hypothetical protein